MAGSGGLVPAEPRRDFRKSAAPKAPRHPHYSQRTLDPPQALTHGLYVKSRLACVLFFGGSWSAQATVAAMSVHWRDRQRYPADSFRRQRRQRLEGCIPGRPFILHEADPGVVYVIGVQHQLDRAASGSRWKSIWTRASATVGKRSWIHRLIGHTIQSPPPQKSPARCGVLAPTGICLDVRCFRYLLAMRICERKLLIVLSCRFHALVATLKPLAIGYQV
jgi:hypothetical protein